MRYPASKNNVTLKTGLWVVQGLYLKMAPFDGSYTTFYCSAIVTIAQLYLVPFSSYLALDNIATLQSGLEVTQDH